MTDTASRLLTDLVAGTARGAVEVIDLTAPLSDQTPILQLPPPFANTQPFRLQEISAVDERGPAWYWNNFSAGEHVGTHFDAPVHWITGQRRRRHFAGAAAAADRAGRGHRQNRASARTTRTFCSRSSDIEEWQRQHGPLPKAAGCSTGTGWDTRAATRRNS